MLTTRLLAGALGVLLVAACGDDEPASVGSTPTPTATPTASASTGPSPTAAATPTSTLPAGVDQVVTIGYLDGRLNAPKGRVKVRRGSTVQLVVTSDKADEVHLHGYDKSVDVTPGGTARLTFTASIPGVFEVELEHHKVTLVRLQVQ